MDLFKHDASCQAAVTAHYVNGSNMTHVNMAGALHLAMAHPHITPAVRTFGRPTKKRSHSKGTHGGGKEWFTGQAAEHGCRDNQKNLKVVLVRPV